MGLAKTLGQAEEVSKDLINRQGGKWLLSQMAPNEFEYYMVAFELLQSDLTTSKYFIFPIMPNNIEFVNTEMTKVVKTAGGISVLKTSQFNIKDITLSGNFGKNFKVLLGTDYRELVSTFINNQKGGFGAAVKNNLDSFSNLVKTGYGCTKVLEDILLSSNQKDIYGNPHLLIFYNLAFNQKFFVEVESQSYSQSLESNMIWNYSIKLKAISNSADFISSKKKKQSNSSLIINDKLQKNVNGVRAMVGQILKKKLQ